jgi:hypothetical protein
LGLLENTRRRTTRKTVCIDLFLAAGLELAFLVGERPLKLFIWLVSCAIYSNVLGHTHRDRLSGLALLLNRGSLVVIELVDVLVQKIGERRLIPEIFERRRSVIGSIRRRDGGGWWWITGSY